LGLKFNKNISHLSALCHAILPKIYKFCSNILLHQKMGMFYKINMLHDFAFYIQNKKHPNYFECLANDIGN